MNKMQLLVLDESFVKLDIAPTSTLTAPGEQSYIVVDDNSAYAKRYDMIACISIDRVFPPIIYSPSDRTSVGAKGINTKMLIKYIQDVLAQSVGAMDRYPLYLIIDNASIHNKEKIIEAFHDNGCQELVDVQFMPPYAAKRFSPLDNSLFHQWKEGIRCHGIVTDRTIRRIMSDEWNKITSDQIKVHFHHCGFYRDRSPYFDCPAPASHRHNHQ
jgi:hypothetical protein